MKQVINLILLFLILVVASGLALVFENREKAESDSDRFFCGNVSTIFNSTEISEGKTLFRNYCASCHDKSMMRDMTGPKLKDFSRNWNNDTLTILDYLQSSETFLDTSKMDHILSLKKEQYAHLNSHNFVNLSKTELKYLMEFIEHR